MTVRVWMQCGDIVHPDGRLVPTVRPGRTDSPRSLIRIRRQRYGPGRRSVHAACSCGPSSSPLPVCRLHLNAVPEYSSSSYSLAESRASRRTRCQLKSGGAVCSDHPRSAAQQLSLTGRTMHACYFQLTNEQAGRLNY